MTTRPSVQFSPAAKAPLDRLAQSRSLSVFVPTPGNPLTPVPIVSLITGKADHHLRTLLTPGSEKGWFEVATANNSIHYHLSFFLDSTNSSTNSSTPNQPLLFAFNPSQPARPGRFSRTPVPKTRQDALTLLEKLSSQMTNAHAILAPNSPFRPGKSTSLRNIQMAGENSSALPRVWLRPAGKIPQAGTNWAIALLRLDYSVTDAASEWVKRNGERDSDTDDDDDDEEDESSGDDKKDGGKDKHERAEFMTTVGTIGPENGHLLEAYAVLHNLVAVRVFVTDLIAAVLDRCVTDGDEAAAVVVNPEPVFGGRGQTGPVLEQRTGVVVPPASTMEDIESGSARCVIN